METNAHTFVLTKKQERKLQEVIDLFCKRAGESNAIPSAMLLLLGGVRYAILESEGLEQHQMDVVIWVLDLVFAQMKEDEYDPQLEQIYHKLTGFWPTNEPWFERIKHESSE
jgi:hypothetical protein